MSPIEPRGYFGRPATMGFALDNATDVPLSHGRTLLKFPDLTLVSATILRYLLAFRAPRCDEGSVP
jgi:hypothetical protein